MRKLARQIALLGVFVGAGAPVYMNAWGMADDSPKSYSTEEGAMQAFGRIRREIHVGMTSDEVRQLARNLGAKIFEVGFITGPGMDSEKDLAPRNYGLGIAIAGPASSGPSERRIMVMIRDNVVTEVRDMSEAAR